MLSNISLSKVTPEGAKPGHLTFFDSLSRSLRTMATWETSPRVAIPKLHISKNVSIIESALNDLQEVNVYLRQLNTLKSSQEDNDAYASNQIVIDYLLLSKPQSLTECSHILKRFNPHAANIEAPLGSRLSPKINGLKSYLQATFFLDYFLSHLIDRDVLKQKNLAQPPEKKNQNEILYEYLQSMIVRFRAENQDIQEKCDETEDSIYDHLENSPLSGHPTATFFSSTAKPEEQHDNEPSVDAYSDAESDGYSKKEDTRSVASLSAH